MEERILTDLWESYGLGCLRALPVKGGWLNRLWRVSTGGGEFLVKQFSRERYSDAKLEALEYALQRQAALARMGIPCPAVRLCGGRVVRRPDGETAYMVMDFSPGWTEASASATVSQMHSLGDACGRMHRAFAQLPEHLAKGTPPDGQGLIDALWAHYRACRSHAPAEGADGFKGAVDALEPVLKRLDSAFLKRIPRGIAHEDFTSDNILFETDRVSAVIDFDRNRHSFLWHDAGRAVLSFALTEDGLDLGKIRAFLEGYSKYYPMGPEDMADALRLAWCIEVPWWIQPEYFGQARGKATRFRDEILWVTEHWSALDAILGG